MSKEQAVNNECQSWLANCNIRFLRWRHRNRGQQSTFEAFRTYAERDMGQPHHPGVWGGVAATYIREGWLRPVGYGLAGRASSHKRVCRVYKIC